MRIRSIVLILAALAAVAPVPARAGHACEGVALQTIPGTGSNGFGEYPAAAGWGGCTLFASGRVGFVGFGTYHFTVHRAGRDPIEYTGTREYACKARFARLNDQVDIEITEGAFFIWRETTPVADRDVPTELPCPA